MPRRAKANADPMQTLESHFASKPARAQPVRDAILAFMTEPRQAFEIARHTGKSTASITGHMRTMLVLGLVERVAYGRYALAGTSVVPPNNVAFMRPDSRTDAVLATLTHPKTSDEVATALQLPVEKIISHLLKMRKNGVIWCNQNGLLARISGGDDKQNCTETLSVLENH